MRSSPSLSASKKLLINDHAKRANKTYICPIVFFLICPRVLYLGYNRRVVALPVAISKSMFQGNMLDNTELLQTLEDTKSKATEVFEKLELAATTATDIDRLRDGFRPVAKRGALLFFVLSDMATVNSMYQYSLAAYLQVGELPMTAPKRCSYLLIFVWLIERGCAW